MEDQPTPTGPDVDRLIVHDDLLEQLRKANERFHLAKAEMEAVMDDSEMRHVQRVEEQIAKLREAEKEVEEITAKIDEVTKRKP